jgi:protein adenylyltransferase
VTLASLRRPLESLRIGPGISALGERFVERRDPTPLPDPYLVAFNPDVAELLGFDAGEANRPEFLRLASGNARFGPVPSYAAVYAGHQFGTYVTQLGDGRALGLGEVLSPHGERYEWQLKGTGLTAFSRFADGRAVLRSAIREYLGSEALHHLGIPTTRALAVAGSDFPVQRETVETAAVFSRVAPTHVRFGSFEYFHYRRMHADLKILADYTIADFFPEFANVAETERYARFLREVVERTARLVAQWQAVGFAHGVLNTDNMSILGLTLDYGPYGFSETFDPGFICNHSDDMGRYAFGRQPAIGLWNCRALAHALESLVAEAEREAALAAYEPAFEAAYAAALRAKLGLREEREGDLALIEDALDVLERGRADYTLFFRALSRLSLAPAVHDDVARLFEHAGAWHEWLPAYRARLAAEGSDDSTRHAAMLAVNPKFVLRNHLAQAAIAAAQQRDYSEIARLHDILRRPFDEHGGAERYAGPAPPGTPPIEVSCSS